MTDLEYEILDELYFVCSFKALQNNVNMNQERLILELISLLDKEWIKLYDSDAVSEIEYVTEKFNINFNSYYYLATKRGLFEHNSI